MRYRTGRRNGHTIYRQLGEQPSDDDHDGFVGSCVSPERARVLVEQANNYESLLEEVVELSEALVAHGGELDGETVIEAAIRVLEEYLA